MRNLAVYVAVSKECSRKRLIFAMSCAYFDKKIRAQALANEWDYLTTMYGWTFSCIALVSN